MDYDATAIPLAYDRARAHGPVTSLQAGNPYGVVAVAAATMSTCLASDGTRVAVATSTPCHADNS
jgi:hypothetical protein